MESSLRSEFAQLVDHVAAQLKSAGEPKPALRKTRLSLELANPVPLGTPLFSSLPEAETLRVDNSNPPRLLEVVIVNTLALTGMLATVDRMIQQDDLKARSPLPTNNTVFFLYQDLDPAEYPISHRLTSYFRKFNLKTGETPEIERALPDNQSVFREIPQIMLALQDTISILNHLEVPATRGHLSIIFDTRSAAANLLYLLDTLNYPADETTQVDLDEMIPFAAMLNRRIGDLSRRLLAVSGDLEAVISAIAREAAENTSPSPDSAPGQPE